MSGPRQPVWLATMRQPRGTELSWLNLTGPGTYGALRTFAIFKTCWVVKLSHPSYWDWHPEVASSSYYLDDSQLLALSGLFARSHWSFRIVFCISEKVGPTHTQSALTPGRLGKGQLLCGCLVWRCVGYMIPALCMASCPPPPECFRSILWRFFPIACPAVFLESWTYRGLSGRFRLCLL